MLSPMADAPPDDAPAPLVPHASPYPVSRLSPRFDLVDLAAEIARADETVSLVASAKLEVIRQQIVALQEKARAILDEAAFAAELHRARCNFRKVPGRIYHLYRRAPGELYFSMLSPEEWGGAPPHPFEGSFRLETDQTFTRVGDVTT
jgi:Protein of unknown function (DUF2452)